MTVGGRTVNKLPLDTWGWVLFKLVLGFGWTHAMLLVTPRVIADQVTVTSLLLWTVGTAIGAIVSLTGLLVSVFAHERRAQLTGLSVELVGIVLFAGGPLQYLFVQIGLSQTDFLNRYALCWFAASMLSAIGVRLLIVGRLFLREAKKKSPRDEVIS
ncbi:MAG TPA: hypothetical protein VIL55_03760 [Naasia sp.]